MPSWPRAVAAWFLILVLAMLNGFYREAVLLPQMGTPGGLAASGLLLALAVLAVAILLARWLRLPRGRRSLAVGALWLAMTVSFEFGFGRLVLQQPWPELLEPYTFANGNMWPLVLLVILLAPRLAARLNPPRG